MVLVTISKVLMLAVCNDDDEDNVSRCMKTTEITKVTTSNFYVRESLIEKCPGKNLLCIFF